VTQQGRVAEAEVCESGVCDVGNLLVRGDKVSFISEEKWKRLKAAGFKRTEEEGRVIWTPYMPAADVKLPRGYVVVHDTTGALLSKCDLYIVKWYSNSGATPSELPHDELKAARDYFGPDTPIKCGSVDIPPDKAWRKLGRVRFIRYFRAGHQQDDYEHEFDPAVDLFDMKRPLAWRMPLPNGCVVDDRGFVWP
jgi:hypothetical protein